MERAPDSGGEQYFERLLSWRQSSTDIANVLLASPEFTDATAGDDGTRFVPSMYRHAFDRAPTADELSYWNGRSMSGMDRGSMAAAIADAPESRSATAEAMHEGWVWTRG